MSPLGSRLLAALDEDRVRLLLGDRAVTGHAVLAASESDLPWPDDDAPDAVLSHCLSRWGQGRPVIVGGGPSARDIERTVQEQFPGAALVVPSSGSTGAPRQVVLGPGAVLFNLDAIAQVLPAPGRMAGLSPVHHVYGLVGQLLWTVAHGGVYLAGSGGTAFEKVRTALSQSPEGVQLVPPQLSAVLDLIEDGAPAPAWVASAGARVDGRLWRRWREVMPDARRYTQYGCTEAGPRLCTWCDDGTSDMPGLVGAPLPGVVVGADESGRLFADTPGAMSGTLEHVAGAWRATPHQGRIMTGDEGALDEHGRVIVYGRADFVINTGGVRVSPFAVEDALLSVPGIEAAVVGPVPSPRLGQVVKAAIATRRDPDEVIATVRAELSGAMRPRAFCFWSELPTLGSGKVDRLAALKGPSDGEHP